MLMKNSYEIERKYFVETPDFSKLCLKSRKEIVQTYLKRDDKGLQRRVRKITESDKVFYTYTEKEFLSALIRKEKEYEITENEYESLLMQSDENLVPVIKVRYDFIYENQLFELDVYSFNEKYAILEHEIDSPEQESFLPDFINVIKEVTDDSRYSNAALAIAGEFPNQ